MKIVFLLLIIIVVFVINILFIIKKAGISKDIINNVKLNKINGDKNIDFRYDKINFEENTYQRDLSFDKNLNYIYWLSINYKIINNKTNILGAYLTKWYKNNNITIIDKNNKFTKALYKLKKKGFMDATNYKGESIIKNKIYISFNKNAILDGNFEKELFDMMRYATISGDINEDEFMNWLIDNSSTLNEWFDRLYNNMTDYLIDQEKIFSSKDGYVVSDSILKDATELNNYKNFLSDFDIFNDKQIKEVHLYDNYLINSVLLGINDKIKEELGNIYPKFLFDIENIISELNSNVY